jgi:hypothetical protein
MNTAVEVVFIAFFGTVVALTLAAVLTRFAHQLRGQRFA